MPWLVPGIHVFVLHGKAWLAGTSPAMTLDRQSVLNSAHRGKGECISNAAALA
ncbi:hypothetical protein [Bradyrhizobium sp. STM 3561]|uniref:hypothetical protein n=1 Tax=unclassified Bradyrhizobium TaxID=2631580 RepID=UPI0026C23CC0